MTTGRHDMHDDSDEYEEDRWAGRKRTFLRAATDVSSCSLLFSNIK